MHKKKIQTIILMIMMLTVSVCACSIEFVPGSGRDVTSITNLTRDRDFFYHTNSDDQHWYGTHKWAVRFDFSDVYPTYDSSGFVINKVKAYFPITPNPISEVSVAIHSDAVTSPGIIIATTTVDSVSDWIEFILDEPVTVSSCWMVVTCSTAVNGPYISASVGGGQHSWYWNTNMPSEYFQNLYQAGIYSEFLFSVTGHFELSDTDIELSSFNLKPEITPGSRVYPEFTIINNTDTAVDSAFLALTVTSPNPEFALQDTVYVNGTIAPNSSVFLAYDDPVCQLHPITLPDYPTQFKVRAVLHSEFDPVDTLFNNTKTAYYNSFNRDIPFKMVENFVRTGQDSLFLLTQDAVNVEEIKPVNYFPVVTDTYYQLGAVQRFNWYGFSGQPMTVLGGDHNIAGFVPVTYADNYTSAIDELSLEKTFLTENSISFNLPEPYTNISVRLMLRNPDTYVFSDGVEPSIIRQSRFYAALCKKEQLFDRERYVFVKWAAYQDTIATAIPMGETWFKQFSFSVSNIGLDSLMTDYDLIYWVQHHTNKQVFFSGMASLSQIVSNDEDTIPVIPFTLSLAPNPVRAGRDLHLSISGAGGATAVGYRIYNIKGQLVCKGTLDDIAGNSIIPIREIKASGLYLFKFSIQDKSKPGKPVTQTKKIIIY
jgi:hypothetical protein